MGAEIRENATSTDPAEPAELAEIRDFLAGYPPFSLLPNEAIAALPALFAVRYQRRGSDFPPIEEKAACLYVVRKGAIELRSTEGALIDKLGEGDVVDDADVGEHSAGQIAGIAVEDTLLYLLPRDRLQTLRRNYPTLDEYFVKSAADRLRHGRHVLGGSSEGQRPSLMTLPVGDFVRRKPVSASASMSIYEATCLMTREGVSALLVVDAGKLSGIVTDRDLRSRCLAEGLATDQPIARIMSTELASIGPESSSFEALMLMTSRRIHHLPVVDGAGVYGLVSATDLMCWQSANAVYLAGLIHKADGLPAIVRASAELPELQLRMQASGATPGQVGQAVSSVNDAITCRLIELAQADIEAEFGPAPISFAWLACGSQGRHEQTVHTDQDNALMLADTYDSALHGPYFEALALWVNDGLNACGYRYCPGKIMASNPAWRLPQARWIEIFRGWITHADNMTAMLAANFLDLRTVYGDPWLLTPLHDAIKQSCSTHETFLARMVTNALKTRPPLGFFRSLTLIADGEHADTFNIKRNGLIPITDIARIHALKNGLSEIGTVARLRAAGGTASLSTEAARELEEAFEYFGSLRLRHQAAQIRRGLAPDNYLSPAALTALERTNLKDAFAVVTTMQKVLAQQYPHRIHE